MAKGKIKYDGILEAAHFKPDGQLDWVRVYLRREAVFSDRIILSREAFVKQLQAGKSFWLGERIINLGGQFTIAKPVHLLMKGGKGAIVVGEVQSDKDSLVGVPVI